jgi:hypothetical protein
VVFWECLKHPLSLPPPLRERVAFAEGLEIRERLFTPSSVKKESCENHEELKTKTIHVPNGCPKHDASARQRG